MSLVESAQIARDAHGITSVITNDNATGLPSSPMTLAVSADADFDRALAVLRDLQRTPPRPWWEASWAPRALLLLLVMLVVALCGLMIFG